MVTMTRVAAGGAEATWARWPAGASLFLAGAAHLYAGVEHADHGTLHIGFFLGAGVVQILLGWQLFQAPRTREVVAAAAVTLGLIATFVVSRTTALLPAGAGHHDSPDPAALSSEAVLGLVVVSAELVSVVALPMMLSGRVRAVVMNAVLLTGVGMWVLWLGAPLLT